MRLNRHTSRSRQNNRINHNTHPAGQKGSAENVIVFSPTTNRSSEKNRNDSEKKQEAPKEKKKESGLFHFDLKKLTDINLDRIFDSISDDIILLALIAVLLFERFQMKKNGADKSELSDYDLMIMALAYIFL